MPGGGGAAHDRGKEQRRTEGRMEECKSGAAGTIIVAEKAPEILEPGRVL